MPAALQSGDLAAMRIACLHTVESNIAVFEAARRDLGLEATLTHAVRADLLADAERAGGLTQEIRDRAGTVLAELARSADAVLLTCSTVGPAIAEARRAGAQVPVFRVDGALAEAAVADGGKVVALCAVETTIGPTRALFEDAAKKTGCTVEVVLVPGAWARFKSGDREGYERLVAEAADKAAAGGAQVALAQASMAGAARLAQVKPLTSPAVGLKAAVQAAEREAANHQAAPA
jgi:hypothetical protein